MLGEGSVNLVFIPVVKPRTQSLYSKILYWYRLYYTFLDKPKGQSKIDNPEKLSTHGTQDKEKKTKKQHTQYVLNTTTRKQTQIT